MEIKYHGPMVPVPRELLNQLLDWNEGLVQSDAPCWWALRRIRDASFDATEAEAPLKLMLFPSLLEIAERASDLDAYDCVVIEKARAIREKTRDRVAYAEVRQLIADAAEADVTEQNEADVLRQYGRDPAG